LLQYFSAWFFLFLFFYDFLRNYLFQYYFLILSWLKITITICEESIITFLANCCGLLQCFFPHGFFLFCYVFPSNCLCQFYFLNIELVKNCNYKFFLTKHYGLIQFFLTWVFFSFFCVLFCNIFFKIIFIDFIFLILSWLEFNFTVDYVTYSAFLFSFSFFLHFFIFFSTFPFFLFIFFQNYFPFFSNFPIFLIFSKIIFVDFSF